MNHTSEYQFTIIIPVFNEEENISALEEKLSLFLPKSLYRSCVLFVNDGSRDTSLERIKDVCSHHKDFFYISFQKNAGLSAAIKAGIDICESSFVGYIDADLQTNPEDFNLLLEPIKDFELVMGIRANRKDTAFKKLQSKIANGFRRMMTHDGVQDTGCPLKVMHTDYAKRVPFFTGMHRFLPALFLLQDARIKQIPVRHYPRTAGQSKYNLWNRLVAPFIDCFAYRWMKKRYINYHISENNIES
ncbi:MAG: glycosyltransferase family 2 protein [Bacteroidaceae bacterium]|jgi:glycosyltransferase involved in cell wall biosynthesis